MFGKFTGFMSNDQVEKDTAALQNYIQQMKNAAAEQKLTEKAASIFNETLKDSSKIAQDVAQNTNNLDDVMKYGQHTDGYQRGESV